VSPSFTSAAAPGLRVGIDLCSAADVAESIANFGDHYLRRVFTDAEIATCSPAGVPEAERLAARFAAKEATVKSLQPTDTGLDLHHIEVTTGAGGWAEIRLSGAAARLADEAGLTSFAVSITHEGGMAAAVVIALPGAPAPAAPTHQTNDPTNEGGTDVH